MMVGSLRSWTPHHARLLTEACSEQQSKQPHKAVSQNEPYQWLQTR